MAMVAHLHHLFNAETCQSYIHRVRWKDRPPNVHGVRATMSVRGAPLTTSPA
jgi:hypothetical protein